MNLLNASKITDLTHSVNPEMQVFNQPWHRQVSFEILGTIPTVGRRTTHVHLGTHSGTHIDAPSHFLEKGATITDIKLDSFIGETSIIDLSHLPDSFEVTSDTLEEHAGHRQLKNKIILNFGWSKKYGSKNFYSSHPYLAVSAANWILEKGINLLGYDTPMPDNPSDGRASDCDSPIHKLFLGNDVVLLEYMNNLQALKKENLFLIALPLRLEGLDGSPVRCIGIEE